MSIVKNPAQGVAIAHANNLLVPTDNQDLQLEKIDEVTGYKQERIIKDYELMMFTNGGRGTAWVLDFELPKDGKYPTKGFFATNFHVISYFDFPENKYWSIHAKNEPLMEEDSKEMNILTGHETASARDAIYREDGMILAREMREDFKTLPYSDFPELGSSDFSRYRLSNKGEIRDAADKFKDLEIGVTAVYKTKIKKPKLFYAAVDFLKETPSYAVNEKVKHYYKDFAVVEVDFDTEQIARLMTKDFYTRYYLNHQSAAILEKQLEKATDEDKVNIEGVLKVLKKINERYKPLDLFADIQSKTNDKEKKYTLLPYENYFSAGYSKDVYNLWNAVGNYSPITEHSMSPSLTRQCREVNGFGAQPLLGTDKNEPAGSLGCNYDFVNAYSTQGASGSLVTNKKGEVLGLYRASKMTNIHHPELQTANVEGIRSKKLTDEKGREYSPAYDLIEGTEGQEKSYKSQLEKNYPNMDTYLKELRSGNKKSETNK